MGVIVIVIVIVIVNMVKECVNIYISRYIDNMFYYRSQSLCV